MNNNRLWCCLYAFLCGCSILAMLSTVEAETKALRRPSDFQITRLTNAPRIDGQLSPGEWDGAVTLGDFYQVTPGDNDPATEATTVYIGYDSQNFYVAFDCRASDPSKIRALVAKRDEIFDNDRVFIVLDTFNDQRRAYDFTFNPFGIQADSIVNEETGDDITFDTLLTSKGNLTNTGYVVEAAIPFRSLRYNGTRWGIHLGRVIISKNERDSWMPLERGNNSYLRQEGHFDGLEGLPRNRNLELIPTFTLSEVGQRVSDNQFLNRPLDTMAGLSIKYGITPNLTADIAIRPDFSQVEADFPQIQVNNRFPLFFPERRPFFLEGADIFRTNFDLFQTRQIAAPLIAAKVTGKIGRTSLGVLTAVDENTSSLRFSDAREEFTGNALFSILRVKRDILSSSNVGVLISDREFAGSFNRVASIDSRFLFGNNEFTAQYVKTLTKDLDGRFSDGHGLALTYFRSARRGNVFSSYTENSPDYRVDSGFTFRTNVRSGDVSGGYDLIQNNNQQALIRRSRIGGFQSVTYNYQGELTDRDANVNLSFSFRGNTSTSGFLAQSQTLFAGQRFDTKSYGGSFSTQFSKKINGSALLSLGEGILFDASKPQVGNRFNYNLALQLVPQDNLRIRLNLIHSELKSKTGQRFFSVSIYRANINQQFTRNTSLRAIVNYDTFSRQATANFLMVYSPNPGTSFFVGYNDLLTFGDNRATIQRESGAIRQQRAFFIKLSYLLRL
jgi:Domain of unknown function (DUF5916)/Carbohydrate family 9 binding domain-like